MRTSHRKSKYLQRPVTKLFWKLPEMKTPEMETMGPVADRQTLREILEVVLMTKKRVMTAMIPRSCNDKVSNYCTEMLHCDDREITDTPISSHQDS
jgi:hypothetical protein